MRKPKNDAFARDAMTLAYGAVIGFALALELMVVMPDRPIMAAFSVTLSGALATWSTIATLAVTER